MVTLAQCTASNVDRTFDRRSNAHLSCIDRYIECFILRALPVEYMYIIFIFAINKLLEMETSETVTAESHK